MRSYENFIGGEFISVASGKRFTNVNPADTREQVASYPQSGAEESKKAIAAAQAAFEGWSRTTPIARGRILNKASQILETRKPELAELLTREEGKTVVESTGRSEEHTSELQSQSN